MSDSNLTFAKIVANPNAYSWSQAYNAGKLFAVLSLEAEEESQEKDYLNVLGKEILDTLEQEFFTLETKDLESIKQAVITTSEKIPQEINCSFVICSVVGNVLYVYILGNGKIRKFIRSQRSKAGRSKNCLGIFTRWRRRNFTDKTIFRHYFNWNLNRIYR